MKKLKKLLSIVACCAMFVVSAFTLTGCTQEELKESTETVIDTTTSIIPVELSKETAKGMYTSALQNWLETASYEITFTGQQGSNGVMKTVEKGLLNSLGQRYIYISYGESDVGEVVGFYNDSICELDLEEKTYSVIASSSESVLVGAMGDAFGGLYSWITAGRYYNGYYYISAEQTRTYTSEGGSTVTETDIIELMIKDGKFAKGSFATFRNSEILQIGVYEFKYTNVDVSMIPTSLAGFTVVE